MVVFASAVGFSAAFGTFIMGSILAETVEAEKIEHLVTPVKDLFGAIFFVSVGMMVDVALIAEYIVPILGYTIHWSGTPGIFIVLAILFAIVLSPRLQARSERMTQTFTENLTERERREKAENELISGNIG